MTADLIPVLRDAGWQILEGPAPLPTNIHARYPWVPPEVFDLLERTRQAVNASETAWLVTADVVEPDEGFRWNEWELLALQAAGSNEEWASEIRRFWDNHFPFALSVKDGYAYFAVKNEIGFPVVYGREPEFEEPELFAGSFEEWVQRVVSVLEGGQEAFEIESSF